MLSRTTLQSLTPLFDLLTLPLHTHIHRNHLCVSVSVKSLLSLLLLSVLSLPSVVLGVDFDELVKRDGLYYKKFTNVPFTGKITGKVQGSSRNGKRDGPYVWYHDNGQLKWKGTYKDGKEHGPYAVSYTHLTLPTILRV